MVQLHSYGLVFLLSVLALVWAADIGAYFAGKAFGKRKLAPTISPGKSWAGVYGGMVAGWVLLLVGVFMVAAREVGDGLSVGASAFNRTAMKARTDHLEAREHDIEPAAAT